MMQEANTCGNCRHYRETQTRSASGEIQPVGYCRAIASFPYRTADHKPCKRWGYIKTM